MKTAFLKIQFAALALTVVAACGTRRPLTTEEAAGWVAACPPERIDKDAALRFELTEALQAHIDTLRPLGRVFRLTPSVEGVAHYAEEGRVVEFVPARGALKQGRAYTCRVRLAALAAIDSLRDFECRFVVEKRESHLSDLCVRIDPDDAGRAVVTGRVAFNCEPAGQSAEAGCIDCPQPGAAIVVRPTDDPRCHTFSIKGIERKTDDFVLQVGYEPGGDTAGDKASVVIPGTSVFKLLAAERCEDDERCLMLHFSAPLDAAQEWDGLLTVDGEDATDIESGGTNLKVRYPASGLPDRLLRVSGRVRSADGRTLGSEVEQHFRQEVIPPAVEIPVGGSILPDEDNLTLPFRSVNLAAVDVEVVKVYTGNVLTFLQECEMGETGQLRRVGRLIYRQTVRLDRDERLNLHQWQTFSVDLRHLFRQERGAVYNIRISFRRAYSLYGKTHAGELDLASGLTRADRDEWDEAYTYVYREAPDYRWQEYDWREADDPSKASYYMVAHRMAQHNVVSSELGLVVKRADSDRLWCTVSHLLTAQAASGVRVTAYNYQMRPIGSACTDGQGFADFPVRGNPFVVTASDGASTTYLKINGGHELSTSWFDVGGKKTTQGIKGFVYGERGIWRPGDDIFLTLLVEDRQRTLPRHHPVTLELYTPQGQLYDRQTLTEGVDGLYAFTTRTADDAPTGRWNARFRVGGQTFHQAVRVETIKPNRLKIDIAAPEVWQGGREAQVGLEARWLTGLAASGLDARVELLFAGHSRPFKRYGAYVFADPLYNCPMARHEVLACRLDSLGRGEGTCLLPSTDQMPGMMLATLTATVAESGGDVSLTSRSVCYSPYEAYVGVDLQDRTFETDCDLHFPVVVLDAEGKPLHRTLAYKIYRLDWDWWWEGSADDLNRYVQSTTAEVVAAGSVETQQGKGDISFRVDYPTWGRYLVRVEDPVGGHASGGVVGIDWPDWRGRSGKVRPSAATLLSFALDKRDYEVGEYATVYLPPSGGGRVLLSIENGSGVLGRQWVPTSAGQETAHRIRVTKEMAPNFYVHAMLLQPHAQTANDLPIRLYGVEGASVVDRRSRLHPLVEVADEVRPQQPMAIRVREQDGRPMSYTLAVVDEGLLDISAFRTPQPWEAMNQREALGVKTWDMYSDVVGASAGRFSSVLSVGGDEALRRAVGKEKRFRPVVRFLGPFTLDKGVRTHTITLPMYVGSVRVMVVAAKDGAYGHADKTVAVRAPLMLMPTLPRRLSCADRFEMPVALFALEKGVTDVEVSVRTEGPLSVAGAPTRRMSFGKDSERVVRFPLVCDKEHAGRARVVVTAVGGGRRASDTLHVEVRRPLPEVVTSTQVVLKGGVKHRFDLSSLDQATLTLASMPVVDFTGAFTFVEQYAHCCTEQLAARAMFMLHARRFLEADAMARAGQALPGLLRTLVARQLPSGGFAYWPGLTEAHAWATSMAGEVLAEARRQGFVVSESAIDLWKTYQEGASRRYRHSSATEADMVQAYRLYTLVLAGGRPLAAMNRLRESEHVSQQALLRLAAAYALADRTDVAAPLAERALSVPASDGSGAPFWSSLRDKAMALEAWLLVGDEGRAMTLAHEVARAFSPSACTTQEVAFVGVAMRRLADVVGGGPVEVRVAQGGPACIVRGLRGVKHFPLDAGQGHVDVENAGREAVSLVLTGYRKPMEVADVPPVSQGVGVCVRYTDLQGRPFSIGQVRQGDEFVAHIDVRKGAGGSSSMALTYAVPSGWEIWNERLVGEAAESGASYADVRDDCVRWYFPMVACQTRCFTVRLRAAFAGTFVLPPVVCEDMYDASCRATTAAVKTEVR